MARADSLNAHAQQEATDPFKLACFACLFSTSSVGMLLINKCAFTGSSFNSGLILVQNLFSLVLAVSVCSVTSSFKFTPTKDKFLIWAPCVVLFVGTIVSSASALSLINVPTFSVFRNSSALIVAVLEYFQLQKSIYSIQGFFLALLMLGSLTYGWNDLQFSVSGYGFSVLHILCIAFYSVSVKKLNAQFSSSLEMSIYNNAGSLPILFAIALYEYHLYSSQVLIENKVCAAASIPAAFLISWSGLITQRMFSATSWMALNNFNKLPMLLLSYIIFNDKYSLGQGLGLAISVFASIGYSYSSAVGTNFDSMYQSLHNCTSLGCGTLFRKRWFYISLLMGCACVTGLNHQMKKLQYFHQQPHQTMHHDMSLASCFQLASACYGNWSKEASHISINHTLVNVVWIIESDAESFSRSNGWALIQNMLLILQKPLSKKPSHHFFVRLKSCGFAPSLMQLQILFDEIRFQEFEISFLPVDNTREALSRMLTADIVIGTVGSLADIVGQFSAKPVVIQILHRHDHNAQNSQMLHHSNFATHDHSNLSSCYFFGSWIDAPVMSQELLNSTVVDELNERFSITKHLESASATAGDCDSRSILNACESHFSAPMRLNSCFWGVKSRFVDVSTQLAEFFAFMKTSRYSSMQFVFEPFFPDPLNNEQSSHWIDEYFGISRLMDALAIPMVHASGLPVAARHHCDELMRLPHADSVFRLKRNPNVHAEHMCPECVFKGNHPVNVAALPQLDTSKTSAHFAGHRWRGSTSIQTKPLTCHGFSSQHSEDYFGWPQNSLSEVVTPSESKCFNKRGLRRCHDVYANYQDGLAVRTPNSDVRTTDNYLSIE